MLSFFSIKNPVKVKTNLIWHLNKNRSSKESNSRLQTGVLLYLGNVHHTQNLWRCCLQIQTCICHFLGVSVVQDRCSFAEIGMSCLINLVYHSCSLISSLYRQMHSNKLIVWAGYLNCALFTPSPIWSCKSNY